MRWTRHWATRRTSAVAVLEPSAAMPEGPAPSSEPGPAQTPAAHGSPDIAPADVPLGCRVVLVGLAGPLRSLPADLPGSWSVTTVDEIGDLTVADLVVLTQPTAGKIASVL